MPTGLKPEEEKLIDFIRELKWGEINVKVKDGKPVMIRVPIKEVKLDS